jgi:hypothetical protein
MSQKGDTVLCLLYLWVLPLSELGGESGAVFLRNFSFMRLTPPHSLLASTPFYLCSSAFRAWRGQDSKVMHMPSLPLTLPGMCMELKVLPHGNRRRQADAYYHLPDLASASSLTV